MGCDIHTFAEIRKNGKWEKVKEGFLKLDKFEKSWGGKEKGCNPFDWRSYSMFAFLAGVRNYDCCEPLSKPKGLPNDSEFLNLTDSFYGHITTHKQNIEEEYHSCSYLTLKELLDFDYEKTFWNRRITKKIGVNSWSGAELAEEGEGEIISYKNNLGERFFEQLEELKTLGEPENVRVVFYFDS